MTKTAEFVSPKHPDKVCDFIADSIIDAYLTKDKNSRVAVEVMGGHGLITLNGEVKSNAKLHIDVLVRRIMGKNYRVVVNFVHQNPKNTVLEKVVRSVIKSKVYYINPAGEWRVGGFDADAGISGRKLVVDAYGPEIPIGGGSFSGKDCKKVDRSGAYMARKIAVDYLKKYKAKEVFTKLAYAIGKSESLMAVAIVDGDEIPIEGYDLSPSGIKKFLRLERPLY